jgi:hypothetical protein
MESETKLTRRMAATGRMKHRILAPTGARSVHIRSARQTLAATWRLLNIPVYGVDSVTRQSNKSSVRQLVHGSLRRAPGYAEKSRYFAPCSFFCVRNSATAAASTRTRGRPSLVPLFRALFSPMAPCGALGLSSVPIPPERHYRKKQILHRC